VRAAETLRSDGLRLNDQVILYRTNAQSRSLKKPACARASPIASSRRQILRTQGSEGRPRLPPHSPHPADTIALLRILNVPSRKIGDTTLGHLQAFSVAEKLSLWNTLSGQAKSMH